jgi:hypothetical protein
MRNAFHCDRPDESLELLHIITVPTAKSTNMEWTDTLWNPCLDARRSVAKRAPSAP